MSETHESLVDLLAELYYYMRSEKSCDPARHCTYPGTSQNDLATDKDEQHDLGLDHAVDQAREQLWLVGREVLQNSQKLSRVVQHKRW